MSPASATPAAPTSTAGAGVTGAASLWELARTRAALTPDALLAVDAGGDRVTFAQFRDRAERLAAGLAARGIGRDDVVSWQLPNRISTMVLAAALSRLGAVQNPLVTMLREREVGFITRQAGTRLLVVAASFRGFDHLAMARAVAAEVPGLDVADAAELTDADPAGLPPDLPSESDRVRWLLYTSGTTSAPKGARHTDRALLAASTTFSDALAVGAADRVAVLAPIAHIGGLAHLVTALRRGSSIVTAEVFDPASTPDLLAAHGVTIVGSGVPFIRAYLARQAAAPDVRLFPQARVFLCGGSPRPASLHAEVRDALGGVGVVSGYGMTECPYVCWGRADDADADHASTEGPPGEGAEVVVVRPDGTRADPGESGEIRVRGPQLMLGYVDATLDAEAFDADGFFRTGDLGFVDERSYLTVTGRLKEVIIRNMENISAREVAEPLAAHPGVADVAVLGVPDPVTGERVCAVVVPADAAAPPALAQLCEHLLAGGLNKRKLPERLEIVDALPRNAMGKVSLPDLRRRIGV
ncbi:class I adenylate-forming enzyme family protein [Frankia sp. QA3]|uniref:class I adenylate-forming enzyme family protein n=1 Tax=Frankia sp. QA3 TaxID=710111 RepID=UPI000269BDBE|nr:AMP-binding protein [Frankia sp. QA3]EIV91846.1 acyl-CoA synthetase (AMP-forming)/AMP-acid ligase II [Frankia sp. QA3]